ncbi:hypothetical protein ACQEV4_01420 [Streptomyces shenzhenensis]|uniref:hypothetical protein n=1 Tax=Streptomyces shenzhenensis TaxID=943815 RepID=UPI003D943AA8
MTDLDNGEKMLVASTWEGQGDLQEVSAAHLLAKVAEQRKQLDRIEALANGYATAATTGTAQPANSVNVLIGRSLSAFPGGPTEVWATTDMAPAHSYEAIYDPARISRADAETAVRTTLAEYSVQVAQFLTEDPPLTAAERGPEWMARYGCNRECQLVHAGPDGEPGWHSTVPVETKLRDLDPDPDPRVAATNPWLAARVVVDNFRPQAYGRTTKVWLDYGTTTGELTPAQAREALTELRGFAAELEAVVDLADAIAVDDFEGDPEILRLDREAEDRRIQAITEGAK